MALNLLERRDFTQQVDKTALKAPKMFLENTFFAGTENHLSNTIDWEKIEGSDRMAVYVNPTESSRLVEAGESSIHSIRIPSTDEHKFYKTYDLATSKGYSGSPYGGTEADIQAYRNQKIQLGINDLINRVRRRREWAAAQALTLGKIEYKSDSLHFIIDFGLAASQKVKNTGDDRWSQSASDISAQGRAHRRTISRASGSSNVIAVLGSDSAEKFLANEKVRATLHNNNLRAGAIDLTQGEIEGATFLGNYGGISYYEYSQSYTDRAGQPKEMWPANLAVYGTPKSPHLRRHRGIIAWEEEGLQRGKEFYSRQIVRKDPDGRKVEIASSEIPIMHDAGTIVIVTTH